MPLGLQAKFLRVLETGVVERVGGERELDVDVRVVSATNVPLERAVASRRFRSDLFHRVAVLRVHAPPLRDRVDDVPLLVDHFLRLLNERYRNQISRVTPEALRALSEYAWPGNVRELRNVLERLHVESDTDVIGRAALHEWEQERGMLAAGAWNVELREQQRLGAPPLVPGGSGDDDVVRAAELLVRALAARGGRPLLPGAEAVPAAESPGFVEGTAVDLPAVGVPFEMRPARAELTEETILEALRRERDNVTATARRLGVHKATLYRHMKRLGIERGDSAQDEA